MSSTHSVFNRTWCLDAGERSLKAFAGGIVAGFGQQAIGIDLYSAAVVKVLESSAALAVVSLALSVLSAPARGISPASVVPPGV